MSVTQSAAPARSDLVRGPAPQPTEATRPARPYFKHGTMLTVGALAWASMITVFGMDRLDDTAARIGHNSGALLFQIGVLALVRVLWRTEALGTGRLARLALRVETGALALAVLSTLSDLVGLTNLDNPASLALDFFWPISMAGMFLIGIRIAVAGRWKGLSRFYPMVAESWAVVTVPTMGIFGPGAARWVAVAHLLVGYAVLGRVVARKATTGD
jgi:hypothetical protein